jgi:putative membrane protein
MWGYDQMSSMVNNWGMGFGFVFWFLIVVAAIAGLSGFIRRRGAHSNGLEILKQRYARGEISREKYLQKKRDIQA